jgi:guanylate kinase
MSSAPNIMPRGKLFVVAAPSGTGKTSLVRALIKRLPTLRFSISYTTREQRATERNTHDYFFVSREEFARMINHGEFLEHASVYGNSYGTSRKQVEDILARGENVLLEIDWQGARQIAEAMPERRSIFILPPSRAELETRLRGRKTDSEEVIAKRLGESIADLSHWKEFDYVVVNDDFERATCDLEQIVSGNGEHLVRDRPEVTQLIGNLLPPEANDCA